jgi:crossover junction endodeoxyribonuclease RusA
MTRRPARIDRHARAFPTADCYHRWDGETLEMLLPFPPSVNVYYRHRAANGFVTTYISADGKAFRQAVRKLLDGAHSFGQARLRVAIVLSGPTKAKRDIANFLKGLDDTLQRDDEDGFAGVFDDDSQIDDYRVVRGRCQPRGCVLVRIREIPPVIPDWTPGRLFEDSDDGKGKTGVARQA